MDKPKTTTLSMPLDHERHETLRTAAFENRTGVRSIIRALIDLLNDNTTLGKQVQTHITNATANGQLQGRRGPKPKGP